MAKTVRVAAVADLHYHPRIGTALHATLAAASDAADVLLLCGDLTNVGHIKDARPLAADLQTIVEIPILAVLGNHDYDSTQADQICETLATAGVTMLDGDGVEIKGVGFAGLCGFGGGFEPHRLANSRDPEIHEFIEATEAEVQRLERTLAQMKSSRKVVLLHYAPITQTLAGESRELYPLLGSSRLEGPLNKYGVAVAFHGHAHHGAPEGHTKAGIPVYNVAIPVLQRVYPGQLPFRLFEMPV